jgi:hypothetical protein
MSDQLFEAGRRVRIVMGECKGQNGTIVFHSWPGNYRVDLDSGESGYFSVGIVIPEPSPIDEARVAGSIFAGALESYRVALKAAGINTQAKAKRAGVLHFIDKRSGLPVDVKEGPADA